jgi:hypothetical protein
LWAIRFFAIQNKINYTSTRLDMVFKNFDVLKQEPLSGKTNFDADNLIRSRKRFYLILILTVWEKFSMQSTGSI